MTDCREGNADANSRDRRGKRPAEQLRPGVAGLSVASISAGGDIATHTVYHYTSPPFQNLLSACRKLIRVMCRGLQGHNLNFFSDTTRLFLHNLAAAFWALIGAGIGSAYYFSFLP